MAHEAYYPPLDTATIKQLKLMQQLAAEHPSYWLDAPYPGDVQRILEDILKPKKVVHQAAPVAKEEGEEEWQFLARETRHLYDQLKVAGVGLEGNELMAFFKTSTSLLEKLLGFQERANNLKQVSDFYHVVLDVMEHELTVDQRTAVMTKLQEHMKG